MASITIRDREPGTDLDTVAAIHNAVAPPDAHLTPDLIARRESMATAGSTSLYLLADLDGRTVGSGSLMLPWWHDADRYVLAVEVVPGARRQGVGKRLYTRLTQYAQDCGVRHVIVQVIADNVPPIQGWLEREGFRPIETMRKSELVLADMDEGALQGFVQAAVDRGVRLSVLTEADTPEIRQALWRLYNRARQDVPHDRVEEQPYQKFEGMLAQQECLRDCLVTAWVGDTLAGFSILAQDGDGRATTWMTGVDPGYRGRGIARAVKAQSALLAREHGLQIMQTFNHVNNPAMLAVNERIGYRPMPERVLFLKDLTQ